MQTLKRLAMIEGLDKLGMKAALDDLSNPHSMISVSVMQCVRWVKLDRCVLRMQDNTVFITFVRQMTQLTQTKAKKIVLEGGESVGDLDVDRALNVNFV